MLTFTYSPAASASASASTFLGGKLFLLYDRIGGHPTICVLPCQGITHQLNKNHMVPRNHSRHSYFAAGASPQSTSKGLLLARLSMSPSSCSALLLPLVEGAAGFSGASVPGSPSLSSVSLRSSPSFT